MKPATLALLRAMDQRDRAQLGTGVDDTPARRDALKNGLIVKTRRMKSGKRWLYRITPAGEEALK